MSEHALRILGYDEDTHTPVHIELKLVTKERATEHDLAIGAFTAPRGFLPAEYRDALSQRPAPSRFTAPRGFLLQE